MPPLLHRQAEARRHRWSGRALRAPLRPARQEVLSIEAAGAERLGHLRTVKLRALVAGHGGGDDPAPARSGTLPGGATLVEGGTGRAWVLIDDGDPAGLGPALLWADREGVADLHVVVDDTTGAGPGATSGVVARRAAAWARSPSVWRVEGRALVPAVPLPPGPTPEPVAAPAALGALLAAAGADPVVEHGVLTGEVLGLEVARAVTGPGAAGWRLEVGVGRLDREARAEMRPDEPDAAAVADVVAVVRAWRRPGAARHPANTLARERWLRAVVLADPGVAGASSLRPVAPPLPRRGVRQGAAAPAAGTDGDGAPVVVVCSTGVDVDVVPTAADTRLVHATADTRLVVVVPEGDDYPVTRRLAAGLRHPAEVRTVRRDWTALTPAV